MGDIEALPYIESVRQLIWELEDDCCVVHLTLIPYLATTGELKTKPTQHSVKTLLESGLQPDVLVCRSERALSDEIKRKLAQFCNVRKEAVVESLDAKSIYAVPVLMQNEGLDQVVLEKLGLPLQGESDLKNWKEFLSKLEYPKREVTIGLIGKYVELKDAYKSIVEAFIHAGAENECQVKLKWIHSESLSRREMSEQIKGLNGALVAPGFGDRGFEGKLQRSGMHAKRVFFGHLSGHAGGRYRIRTKCLGTRKRPIHRNGRRFLTSGDRFDGRPERDQQQKEAPCGSVPT